MSDSFFKDLKTFSDFIEVSNEDNFTNAPEDWHVILTDVRNSTKLIKAGEYRKVNLAGASAITAIQNINRNLDIPFVFGGDGATILIPPSILEEAKKELKRIKKFFDSNFNIDIRVGIIPIETLKKENAKIKVAKYRMDNIALAMFMGAGVKRGEDLIKSGQFELLSDDKERPNLEGLSCRWEPLKSKKGEMLTLIVKAKNDDMKTYQLILSSINKIIHEKTPISLSNLKFKWPPRGFLSEAKTSKGGFTKVFFETLIALIFMKFKLKVKDFDPEKYKEEIVLNADYQKFDDMLRMVIDCSKKEADEIENFLEQKFKNNEIFYGTHRSDSALMTCLVFSLKKEGHTHFIDGNNGGYSIAAITLKSQMTAQKSL